jgi:hypothetical protein
LISAINLAEDMRTLGEVLVARDLDQDSLNRLRRILGDDHPHTRLCSTNLAKDMLVLPGQDNP